MIAELPDFDPEDGEEGEAEMLETEDGIGPCPERSFSDGVIYLFAILLLGSGRVVKLQFRVWCNTSDLGRWR